MASLLDFDDIVKNSLLARSISIPFALVLTEKVGGSISLIPLFTVITGLVGMLLGDLLLLWMKYKNHLASGAALGNAAHALHPIAGQGYNLALRGVVELAQFIIDARRGGVSVGDAGMLQAYHQSRVADQQRTIGLSDKTMKLFSNRNPMLALGRDMGLQLMDICPPAKTLFARGAMGLDVPAPRLK